MLKLIKNFGKNGRDISTETMSVPEYVVAISEKMYEAWNDEYVAERITTKTIFDNGAKVKSGLSFEELYECNARITRAIEIGNEFRRRFDAKYEEIANNDIPDKEEREFFCATNMVNMISEINKELGVAYPKDEKRDRKTLEEAVNCRLKMMSNIYTVNIDATVSLVKIRGNDMYGFI